jgi:hypothetical protein
MTQLTDYEEKVLNRLGELMHNGDVSNSFMVESLKLIAYYSNLSSVKQYSERNGISPQATLRYRNTFKLADFNVITDPQ